MNQMGGTFDQLPMKFEDNFLFPTAEPLMAKQYVDLFVSQAMLKS